METKINFGTFNDYGNSKKPGYEIFEKGLRFTYHWGQLYTYFFNEVFSAYSILTQISVDRKKFIGKLKDKYALPENQIVRSENIGNDFKDGKNSDADAIKAFIIIKHGLAVVIDYDRILIMYNSWSLRDEVISIAEIANEFKINEPEKKEFYMVTRINGGTGYTMKNFEVKEHDICIEDNYNDDFTQIHNIIEQSLSDKKKSGIVLLHGVYGSGKTYYIRHLISTIDKKFIYLPLHMVNWITDPEFLPYMAKEENAVLILEDCENILMHRENGNQNAAALANMLNLSDGLLSDALSLNIICSFNANLKKIDDALLRKGRLIARYEFKELEIPKARQLAHKLQKDIVVEKPMTLTDIYNAESMAFKNNVKAGKVGFVYS